MFIIFFDPACPPMEGGEDTKPRQTRRSDLISGIYAKVAHLKVIL